MVSKESFMRLLHRNVNREMGKEVPRKDLESALRSIIYGFILIIAVVGLAIWLLLK